MHLELLVDDENTPEEAAQAAVVVASGSQWVARLIYRGATILVSPGDQARNVVDDILLEFAR